MTATREPDPDERILRRPGHAAAPGAMAGMAPSAPRRRRLLAGALGLAGLGGGAIVYHLVRPVPAGPPAPMPSQPQPPLAAPPLMAEAALLRIAPAAPELFRWAENPAVFVLVYPTLAQQAAALNRIAALVEKAGLPRDRVVSQQELAQAIARSGERPEQWLLAHDYSGADLDRFARLVARDGTALSEAEQQVLAAAHRARALLPPGQELALISLPGATAGLEEGLRAAILRHELGHGMFFTRPAVAGAVQAVWREAFTEQDRAAFGEFLLREGYDVANEALAANEAMAYLAFTPEQRIFGPQHIAIPAARLEELRRMMRRAVERAE